MIPKIKCTQCGSLNVSNDAKPKPEPDQTIQTMDEYANGSDMTFVPAVMRYTEMLLKCNDCGYKVEYHSPRGGVVTVEHTGGTQKLDNSAFRGWGWRV